MLRLLDLHVRGPHENYAVECHLRALLGVLSALSIVSERERKPETPARSLTVLLQFDQAHSSAWVKAMHRELRRLLAASGLNVELAFGTAPPSSSNLEELAMSSCMAPAP